MEFLKQLKLRNHQDWEDAWGVQKSLYLQDIFLYISETMRHPNNFYLPTDKLEDVVSNKTGDMREVAVLLELEDKLGVDLTEFEKFKMGDLF